jgi:uncharacterized protein (DUF433 family)
MCQRDGCGANWLRSVRNRTREAHYGVMRCRTPTPNGIVVIMASIQRSLRVPEQLDREISREMQLRGERDWSKGAISLMEEAVRTSRVPGIVFVQRRDGRRPAIAFSGLEVWEVIATWKEAGENWTRLQEAYPELSEHQLRAAVAYYRAYAEEIDERLAREAYWTPERVAEELPFTRPVDA